MAWTNDNSACTTTYALLTGPLDQMDRSVLFAAAGAVTLSQLAYFNATASPDIIKQSATGLVNTIDSTLINNYLCSYQTGQTQSLAITALINIMVNGQATVENLSDTVNAYYQFIA
jgi:hypothetical protein